MKSQKNGLDGVTLVAMKNDQPVADQAETVTAMLRPAIAAVLKHTGADTDAPAPKVLKTTEDRNQRIADLEIECATLRHGLRLADRRYEDALASKGAAVPAAGEPRQDSGVAVLNIERGQSGEIYSMRVVDQDANGEPTVDLFAPFRLPLSWTTKSNNSPLLKMSEQIRALATEVRERDPDLKPRLEDIAYRADIFMKLDDLASELASQEMPTQTSHAAPGPVSDFLDDAELRRAVKEITKMLGDREWAEHVSREPDASALESAVTTLIGELSAALDDSGYASMPVGQEPKYGIRSGRLYNRTSGHKIPDNEPVFVLRAKDKKAEAALHFYAGICGDSEHVAAVQSRIIDFQTFARQHARVMKQPDSEHLMLKKLDEQDETL